MFPFNPRPLHSWLRSLAGFLLWVGPAWWCWGFGLMFGFQLLMLVLYPKLILPLFNKLTPLGAGEQRDRLMELADRTGFKAQTIEVMDGSKRSAHSNAFFTGFGRFRRIVLFDTLMAQLSQPELEAVLAHEIGHYKRGHIPQRLVTGALLQFGAFAVVAWLAQAPWFNSAFGLPAGALADVLDRRRILLFTQTWMAVVAGLIAVEKTLPWRRVATYATAALLLALGALLLAAPWLLNVVGGHLVRNATSMVAGTQVLSLAAATTGLQQSLDQWNALPASFIEAALPASKSESTCCTSEADGRLRASSRRSEEKSDSPPAP